MTRAVTQPLLYSATGLPEGARYFGFVVSSRPPASDAAASTTPSGRAVVYAADLIGQSRGFRGRQWAAVPTAPAEVLELIDVQNGQLLTIIRAAFLPVAPRVQTDDASDAAHQRSSQSPRDPPDELQVPSAPGLETSVATRSQARSPRRVVGHRAGRSRRRTRHG